jgi:hypothetical protein
VTKNLPDNATFNDVLPAIRAQIDAQNSFLPYDINEGVNYLMDNRTALATHIAAKYTALADQKFVNEENKTDSLVTPLVERIVQSRKQTNIKNTSREEIPDGPSVLPIPPTGHQFQQYWERAIRNMNDSFKSSHQQ